MYLLMNKSSNKVQKFKSSNKKIRYRKEINTYVKAFIYRNNYTIKNSIKLFFMNALPALLL